MTRTEQPHLLIVDDEFRIRQQIQKFLERNGYMASCAANAEIAENLRKSLEFDLIILDVMMPGEDGFSYARRIRKESHVPIILLTARGLPQDRIEGLSTGADDYLAKPFEPEELVLRIKNILRRYSPSSNKEGRSVKFGPFSFDLESRLLYQNGTQLKLTDNEKDLLVALTKKGGAAVDRLTLVEALGVELDRSVDVHVARLRRKIEDNPKNPRYLQTIRGEGYRLLLDI